MTFLETTRNVLSLELQGSSLCQTSTFLFVSSWPYLGAGEALLVKTGWSFPTRDNRLRKPMTGRYKKQYELSDFL